MADIDQISPKNLQATAAADRKAVEIPRNTAVQNTREYIDPHSIVDVYGNPLRYGNTDPNIIGPDDVVVPAQKGLRDRSQYSALLPNDLFVAEENWVLPLAWHVAERIVRVDLIDEKTYAKIQDQLKQRNIFVTIDLSEPRIENNIVLWEGLRIWCKKWLIVGVLFRLDLHNKKMELPLIKVWQSATQKHVQIVNPNGSFISREQAVTIIGNYFAREKILG